MKKLEEKIIVASVPKVEPSKATEEKPATEAKAAPTLDEMQKKIALQQERLNTLNKMFFDRERFSKAGTEIKRFKSAMESAIKDEVFEVPEFRLVFIEQVHSYKEQTQISVSTPEIMREFLEFIDEKIKNKLQQLDANIVAMAA